MQCCILLLLVNTAWGLPQGRGSGQCQHYGEVRALVAIRRAETQIVKHPYNLNMRGCLVFAAVLYGSPVSEAGGAQVRNSRRAALHPEGEKVCGACCGICRYQGSDQRGSDAQVAQEQQQCTAAHQQVMCPLTGPP